MTWLKIVQEGRAEMERCNFSTVILGRKSENARESVWIAELKVHHAQSQQVILRESVFKETQDSEYLSGFAPGTV